MNYCQNYFFSDIAVAGLQSEMAALLDMQRPLQSQVEQLKKALESTRKVMEYEGAEESYSQYNKVQMPL